MHFRASQTVQALLLITSVLLAKFSLAATANAATTSAFSDEFQPLFENSCIACHSSTELSLLNLITLSRDLGDPRTFRQWERVYDRVSSGEMPPPGMPRPDSDIMESAMTALESALITTSNANRGDNRTALRRLTQLEYAYTLTDLLGIDVEVAQRLAASLPAEADSGSFDTLSANQGISALHIRSFLDAADLALDEAIKLGPRPGTREFVIDYKDSEYLKFMSDGEFLGAGVTRMLDDGAAMFFEVGSTYLMHSDTEGFQVPIAGKYRVTLEAYAFQARSPVNLAVYRGVKQGVTGSLDDLIGHYDLTEESRTMQIETYLRPGELIAPAPKDVEDSEFYDSASYFAPENNVRDYAGEGVVMQTMAIEGPLLESWPPQSTRDLLTGVAFSPSGEALLEYSPYTHIEQIVGRFAQLAFRRPVSQDEVEAIAGLASPILEDGRPFIEAVRVPLRAILSSPSFLYQTGESGELDDFALATRLAAFLWRSMPDQELISLAANGQLHETEVLQNQVRRMLSDERSQRFVKDFAGQAYRLYEIKATSPDGALYPEYDDRLGQAMTAETELFLGELIRENLSISNLIDSDFTFVNRRLAEHYQLDNVEGQHMRRVTLPANSPRGGLLTQAAVHKITANGTTTSPIPRGNFVLTNLLGQPAPPPPPNVAGLEPDTRGTTTIREQLAAHRSTPICSSCHTRIDPPGFAMEVFDPIGGFRDKYRVAVDTNINANTDTSDSASSAQSYSLGLDVNASGITPAGQNFSNFAEYQEILIQNHLKQIARNFISQLMSYGTGAEVSFADRVHVENILNEYEQEQYPVQSLITAVVDSPLFRHR